MNSQAVRAHRVQRQHDQNNPGPHASFCIPQTDQYEEIAIEVHDIGDMIPCQKCGALMWPNERTSGTKKKPLYSLCCKNGKIMLAPIKPPPKELRDLFDGTSPEAKLFKTNIRYLNNHLAFGSFQADIRHVPGHGPPIIQIQGTMYHRAGGLLPQEGDQPKFQALYLHDPENELKNRVRDDDLSDKQQALLLMLQKLMHDHNPLVEAFKTGLAKMKDSPVQEYSLVLSADHMPYGAHSGTYNVPSSDQICALSPHNASEEDAPAGRDIVLQEHGGALRRINVTHELYDAYVYVLLFIYADRGWNTEYTKKKIYMLTHSAHRFMLRTNESCADCEHQNQLVASNHTKPDHFPVLLMAGRLGQQFAVDKALAIEDHRLAYIATHQEDLRADLYIRLSDAIAADDVKNAGKRVILPSSVTDSPRYMQQRYQDAMAVVH